MNRQERFSLRKYKFGVASVLLGAVLVFGSAQASAEEQAASQTSAGTQLVATTQQAPAEEEHSQATEASTAVASEKVEVAKEATVAAKTTNATEAALVEKTEAPKEAATVPETKPEVAEKPVEKATAVATATSSETTNRHEAAEKPQSIESDEIITVPQTWKQGYKGEGMVVAVIDSGLDVNHEVLRITDPSKAKFKNQGEIEAAKKAAGIDYGKWYNDKVVYAYDYFDGTDNIKEAERDSHGMHVTGIATGNPDKAAGNGEKIYGVAPEAQVMFMRVFSDRQKTTGSALYVKAIDDAVALGADTINMSLGSTTGSTVNADSDIVDAIKRARAKGVSVLISAGNSNSFGNGYSRPSAENPDYGLVGNPSTVEDSISVASINNNVITTEVFEVKGLEGNAEADNGKFDYSKSAADADFEKGKEYEYVSVGLGKEDDFKDLDLTGKLALIQRGEIPFSEKIANAFHHGAAGALVYNNVEGSNLGMAIEGDAKKIPSVFISKRYGEALKAGSYKIVFNNTMANRPSPEADQLSDFSSWGVTTDGQLKPDVTAPGGNIFSSLNDNTYGDMSGTSMASPHVAGVAALVKEYLVKNHPELTPEQVSATVKALIMSTAKPHVNKETGVYTSPRQQGAGVVDTAAAVSTDLYVTGENNYPSVTLGNVGDSFTFDVTVHNISDTDRTLKMLVNTDTDEVKDGKFTLRPRKLTETAWPEVTVKAHSSETVTVKVDTSKFTEELSKEMPNGYFLEGFVRFVDPADDGDVVSLPFMGFKGEFQNLPAVEKPIYDLVREGKDGFYYHVPKDLNISSSANVSALVTLQNDLLLTQGKRDGRRMTVLGIEENAEGTHSLQLDENGNVRIAISPNEDGNKDLVEYKTVALRNIENLRATVYAASDTEHKNPLWEGTPSDHRKNFFNGDQKNPRSYTLDNTAWNGTDANGKAVADGVYDYVIRYTPMVPGAEEQSTTFKVRVDTQKPVITSGYIRFKDGAQQFVARKAKDVGEGGILTEKLVYVTPFDDQGTMVQTSEDKNGTRALENYHMIKANADG
ncbi:MAG: S8 family serine peptidase, partial [Streptococcus parasanguinis]|nr:S8 family serine peptidase [Streptococcus parasanguinis]